MDVKCCHKHEIPTVNKSMSGIMLHIQRCRDKSVTNESLKLCSDRIQETDHTGFLSASMDTNRAADKQTAAAQSLVLEFFVLL